MRRSFLRFELDMRPRSGLEEFRAKIDDLDERFGTTGWRSTTQEMGLRRPKLQICGSKQREDTARDSIRADFNVKRT